MSNTIYENPLVTRYASRAMSELWSSQRKHSTWRRLWVALAEAQRSLGLSIEQTQIDELRAQVDDIDFDAGLVRVRRGWDDLEGEIDPKTFAGARDIPMVGELRRICRAHKLQTGRNGTQLFLGRTPADPFYPSTIRLRALKAWGWRHVPNPNPGPPQTIWIKARPDALEPLTPHEARHCAASYLCMSGASLIEVAEILGHKTLSMVRRYAHFTRGHTQGVMERMALQFVHSQPPQEGPPHGEL